MVSEQYSGDTISIVDPAHPVMQGLTSDALSGWGSSSHHYFTDAGVYDVLAVVGGTPPEALTLAASHGSGRIVATGVGLDELDDPRDLLLGPQRRNKRCSRSRARPSMGTSPRHGLFRPSQRRARHTTEHLRKWVTWTSGVCSSTS
jgi:hypothetical protein